MQDNDTQLIQRILEGDTSGYAILVDRHKCLAYTIAFRILAKREDSEEVVQDAFVKAFRNLPTFRQKAKFSTWLYRIVYNTAISRKRIKGPGLQFFEDVPFREPGMDPGDNEEELRHRALDLAMENLHEDERAIITLFYLNDSSVEEIHAITGLSKSNVKIKLFRARKKLQEWIKKPSLAFTGTL